ncbi:MAG TPA: FlgO family outer membrane protein [Chthoniobacterales bacterium]|jgi:TolB-like protein/class 3 adenylate cyclase/Flp pilus assembly protein TadD
MSAHAESNLKPEIAHILSLDVVGYSKLLVDQQIALLKQLNQVVRETGCVRAAEADGKLIVLPTGDGMVLVFFASPEEPLRCAVEISEGLRSHPQIRIRMGAHSGPVNKIRDVNEQHNVAGAGINTAQRVLDCGDAGHILLSKRLADDLAEYGHWRPHFTDLGECTVKHGVKLRLVNFVDGEAGNRAIPEKLKDRVCSPVPSPRQPARHYRWWLMISVTILVALAAGFLALIWIRSHGQARLRAKSIAVLPFQSLSDERRDTYFADGMQDEILRDLAKIADIKVISRTSTIKYRDIASRDLKQIAKELGVRYILEGSVQRASDRIRVQAQLIDAPADAQLWAEHYDRQVANIFALQSEIAEKIASQLQAQITPEEKAAIEIRPTQDVAAFALYVKANAIIDRVVYDSNRIEELWQAEQLLQQATTRDPSFFLAFCRLAYVHDQLYFNSLDHTPARLALAQTALESAQHLQPDVGEVHLAAAAHYYFGYLDYERARQELIAARAKLPNAPYPILLLGYIDRRQGRWDESTQKLEQALDLDPRNLLFLKQLALSYTMLRRYTEVEQILDRAIAIAPNDSNFRIQRAAVELDWHANTKPLHEAIDHILAQDPSSASVIADQWIGLALSENDLKAAAKALEVMTENGCQEEGLPYPRSWCEGLVAREKNDGTAAKLAFTEARLRVARLVQSQPDFAAGISVLGMIDAALGNKENAVAEGRKAADLLPVSKDAITGPLIQQNLAIIYAWTGEKEAALNLLKELILRPGYLSYGQLKLHPYWRPLRSDPRFGELTVALASKTQH